MSELSIVELMHYRMLKKPLPVLVELFDYVRQEGEFFHAVLGPGGDVRFGPRLREAVCSKLIMSLLHDRYRGTHAVRQLLHRLLRGRLRSRDRRWIETGMPGDLRRDGGYRRSPVLYQAGRIDHALG